MTTTTTDTKICIQDIAAYNNGFLVFEWIDLPVAEDKLQAIIDRVLAKGTKLCKDEDYPHEEIELADYESDIVDIGQWSSPFAINEQVEELEALEPCELKKYKYLTSQVGYDHDGAIRNLDDCDIYENMTLNDLAYDFVEEGLFGEIPSSIKNYLDYDAIARDLGFDYTEYDGDIYRAC